VSQKKQKPNSQIPDIEGYYQRLVEKYGGDPRADGYSSELAREARFEMYTTHFDFAGKTILDVGCGTGAFFRYLMDCEIFPARYVGIDILPGKAETAKFRLAQAGILQSAEMRGIDVEFVAGDVSSIRDSFQISIACSIFDVKQTDVPTTFKIACRTLRHMWERSTEGIGADFFSPYALDIQPFNAPIPPEWVFTWAMQNLNSRVLLDYTYLPHDYSIIARKGDNKFVREWKRRGGWEREKGGEE